jgi:hypothetical protein
MDSKLKHFAGIVLIGLALSATSGCNRATVRVPGASTAFPETATHYVAKTRYPHTLVVVVPVDDRKKHLGERVAGTKWTSATTDALWQTDAAQVVQERLVRELTSTGLFSDVTTRSPQPQDLVLQTKVDVFSAQAQGFFVARVVGMCALQISLEHQGKVISNRKYEKVVTDADQEYTGSAVTFIEQAMRVTMADSLRETMKDAFGQIESDAAVSGALGDR